MVDRRGSLGDCNHINPKRPIDVLRFIRVTCISVCSEQKDKEECSERSPTEPS
jgi:hypothetical protein